MNKGQVSLIRFREPNTKTYLVVTEKKIPNRHSVIQEP